VSTLAGAFNHAVYDAGGTLYSCGELGDGTFHSSDHPVKVTGLDGASVTTLVAAWGDEGALLSGGDIYAWGNGTARLVSRTHRCGSPSRPG
jgi:hypothetical protein